MGFRELDKIRDLDREVGEIQTQLARLPISLPTDSIASPAAVILGQVVGVVTGSTSTFQVDNIDLISGRDPRTDTASATETVTFNNTFSQIYNDNDIVLGFRRDATGNFETEKFNAAGGIKIYRFKLLADLTRTATSTTAAALDDTGAATGETINVVDTGQYLTGSTAYTGADGSAQPAYEGYALKFTDDYNATGNPGAHIFSMESPAISIAVKLENNVVSIGQQEATLIDPTNVPQLGSNYSGRIPKQITFSGSGGGTGAAVYNTLGFATDAKINEEWIAHYSPVTDTYELLSAKPLRLLEGTADERILPEALGNVTIPGLPNNPYEIKNVTGRTIWTDADVLVDSLTQWAINTNSTDVLIGTANKDAPSAYADFSLSSNTDWASHNFFNPGDPAAAGMIDDPLLLLPAVKSGGAVILLVQNDRYVVASIDLNIIKTSVITSIDSLSVIGGNLTITYKDRMTWIVNPDAEVTKTTTIAVAPCP